jgi:sec-independent protein translocase protein TatA
LGRVGIQELFLVFFVILLVFGPKRLPELGRLLGAGLRDLRASGQGLADRFRPDSDESG